MAATFSADEKDDTREKRNIHELVIKHVQSFRNARDSGIVSTMYQNLEGVFILLDHFLLHFLRDLIQQTAKA